MLTVQPLRRLTRRILRAPHKRLQDVAERTWQIHPAEEVLRPKAYFLPGQLERIITFSEFSASREEEDRMLTGNARVVHAPTRAFLLKNATILDGQVYAGRAFESFQIRQKRLPHFRLQDSLTEGALYSSHNGNRYFAMWLIDDVVTYLLAKEVAQPVCTQRRLSNHEQEYERWLGVEPQRVDSAHFRELTVFEDLGQNHNKRDRFQENRARLLSRLRSESHPGIFLLRKASGSRRMLRNEEELAVLLEQKRGLRIMDPMTCDIPTILQAAAGAEVVVGVEGSQLAHALVVLERGRSVVTLQPPTRFCSLYKDLTDRDNQHFGFVVGHPEGDDFRVDPDEVERTLDLLPRQ